MPMRNLILWKIIAIMTAKTLFTKIGQITAFTLNESNYQIRPFDSTKDQKIIEEICKDVWNGTDYLPSMARSLEEDDSCDFVVMLDVKSEIVAVGNRRIYEISNNDNDGKQNNNHYLKRRITWIEAIRTSKKHMGKGLATSLVKAFINMSNNDGITEILSCTVEENLAMKKVFDRVDLKLTNKIYRLDFGVLKSLPGWGSQTEDLPIAETILKALNIEHLVNPTIRSMKWTTVSSEAELNVVLQDIKLHGGLGHIPGLGKPYFYDDNIKESLRKGLIRKLVCENSGKSLAVYAITKDSLIQSLKSKWVCAIATPHIQAFEASIWDACSDTMIVKRDNDAAFALVYDGCLKFDSSSSLMNALPIQRNDPFIIFSNNHQ